MHPEQENAEQTAGSSAAKVDADKDNWSAQLRAACHTLGQEQVNNLAAAKDELARALLYVKSTENTLRGLKRQTEVVAGMPNVMLVCWLFWLSHVYLTALWLLYITLCAHPMESSIIMLQQDHAWYAQ